MATGIGRSSAPPRRLATRLASRWAADGCRVSTSHGFVIGAPATSEYADGLATRRSVPLNGANGPATVRVMAASSTGPTLVADQAVDRAGIVSPSASRPLLCSWLPASAGVSTVCGGMRSTISVALR